MLTDGGLARAGCGNRDRDAHSTLAAWRSYRFAPRATCRTVRRRSLRSSHIDQLAT